jgi:hypothetical protein
MNQFWQPLDRLLLGVGFVLISSLGNAPIGVAQGIRQNQPSAKITATSTIKFGYPKKSNLYSAQGNRTTKSHSARGCGNPVALIPNRHLGITAISEPTIWFYAENLSELKLKLSDSEDPNQPSWQRQIANGVGITGIKIPAGKIAEDRRYRWEFSYKCRGDNGVLIEGEALTGEIYRVSSVEAASVQQQLINATPQQRLAIYAQNGIWQELLSELLVLRQQEPTNPLWLDSWRSLLASEDVMFKLKSKNIPNNWAEDRDLVDLLTKSSIVSLN